MTCKPASLPSSSDLAQSVSLGELCGLPFAPLHCPTASVQGPLLPTVPGSPGHLYWVQWLVSCRPLRTGHRPGHRPRFMCAPEPSAKNVRSCRPEVMKGKAITTSIPLRHSRKKKNKCPCTRKTSTVLHDKICKFTLLHKDVKIEK